MEQVKYDVIEKNPRGPKIVNKVTIPRNMLEKELEVRYRPNVFTYSPDDRKVKNRLPLYTMPRGRRGDRTPSPDRRKALIVDLKLTKKNSRKVAILPEHRVTDAQLLKELEKAKLGPSSYEPAFELVEPRPDKGVPKIVRPPSPKPFEQTE
jgi:hypothetical protein